MDDDWDDQTKGGQIKKIQDKGNERWDSKSVRKLLKFFNGKIVHCGIERINYLNFIIFHAKKEV